MLVLVAAWLHRELLLGALPATGDHLCHMFKGWLMADRLVPSGRVSGWSHLSFAGYPAGLYYPVGGDLYLTALRYLSLGLVSWERIYGLGLFGVLVAAPLAVCTLARRCTGTAGALAGGLLELGDLGGGRQGGSVFTVYWGVWPYMLAVSLSLVALALLPEALGRPSRERPLPVLLLAALLALAVLTHPMAAIFLAVAVPLYMVARGVARRRVEHQAPVYGRAVAAGSLAVALALFWLLPQLRTGVEMTESFGEPWMGLGTLLSRLVTNRAFDKFSNYSWALGLAGIPLAFISRRLDRCYPALLLAALILIAGAGGEALGTKVQMERISAFMKGVWFVLAALAVDRLLAGARWTAGKIIRRRMPSSLGRVIEPLLGLLVGASLLIAGWEDHYSRVGRFRPLADATWED
ncbi:MAG: hypothetical protein JRI55_15805, partial [Deltaproteobacteria bacterium]|nr:hypothetical protein [Deltaproteobacteria bacterium]